VTVPGIIAISDDLTGAVAAAAEAARSGVRAQVARWDAIPDGRDADVLVVDMNTRLAEDAVAAARVRETTLLLRDRFDHGRPVYYKRVDSLLRGPVAAEVAAWASIIGTPLMVAVAAPAYAITTENGEQYVHGQRVEVGRTGADRTRTTPRSLYPAEHVDLSAIRRVGFADDVTSIAERGGSVTADVSTIDDLDRIAFAVRAAQDRGLRIGLVGSYGLLGAWLDASRVHHGRGVLIAATSYRSATAAQIAAFSHGPNRALLTLGDDLEAVHEQAVRALRDGKDVAITSIAPGTAVTEPDETISDAMANLVTLILASFRPAGLVVVGGELSSHLVNTLGPRHLDVLVEPWPATPIVRLNGGPHDGLRAVIQSGSQGEPSRLLQVAGLLRALDNEPLFHYEKGLA
jgi:D-threonate/D-erythronate kinase